MSETGVPVAPRHPELGRRSLITWPGYRSGLPVSALDRRVIGAIAKPLAHATLDPGFVAAALRAGLGVVLPAQAWRNQLPLDHPKRCGTFAKLRLHRGLVADEHVTADGADRLGELGIDLDAIPGRRPHFRSCLDWSERRPHAAGKLGAALAAHAFELGWVERLDGSRALRVTPAGEAGFADTFGLPLV
jgi:hypothetical protein